MKWCRTGCVHVHATPLQVTQATVKILLNSKISDMQLSWLTPVNLSQRETVQNHPLVTSLVSLHL